MSPVDTNEKEPVINGMVQAAPISSARQKSLLNDYDEGWRKTPRCSSRRNTRLTSPGKHFKIAVRCPIFLLHHKPSLVGELAPYDDIGLGSFGKSDCSNIQESLAKTARLLGVSPKQQTNGISG